MTGQPAPAAASDERLLAALAHAFGPVVALIIYATQKEKSRFVRFQAMQAAAYDGLAIVVFFSLGGCIVALSLGGPMLGMLAAAATTGPNGEIGAVPAILASLAFILPFAGMCLVFAGVLAALAGRVIAAVNVYQGKNYHHPFLGERVERLVQ